jgi:hypothetical protein
MKTTRTFFLILAAAGFLFSLIIHCLALWGRIPSSESWDVVPFLGAIVSFVSAANLSGARPARMGLIPQSEIVKGCPTWLKRTDYFFFAYVVLVLLWFVLRTPGILHGRKVDLPARDGFVIFSASSMTFYAGSFSMLFGKLFGGNRQDTLPSDSTHEAT